MKHGSQTQIAKELNTTPQAINNLVSGRRNASVTLARGLSVATATDPLLWMQGGSPLERQAAIESWSEKSVTAGQGQGIQNKNGEM